MNPFLSFRGTLSSTWDEMCIYYAPMWQMHFSSCLTATIEYGNKCYSKKQNHTKLAEQLQKSVICPLNRYL